MSLKYMGVTDFCPHGNYEDKCDKCEIDKLRSALEKINLTLRIPAAEYVPAIGDVFGIIDEALNK